MNNASKTYLIKFGSAMAAYTILLPISIALIQRMPNSAWRIPVSLLPMIPVVFALMAILQFYEKMDELQKQIHLSAFAFASLTTGMLTFSYGLLENVGFPHLPFIWILPLMILLWGIGAGVAAKRYQ